MYKKNIGTIIRTRKRQQVPIYIETKKNLNFKFKKNKYGQF